MTCECMNWYAKIDAAFDKVQGLNDVGRVLGQEAAGSLFQQTILVMKSSVPFSRPNICLMIGEGQLALRQDGDGRLSELDRVASRSVALADVMSWSLAFVPEDSFRCDGLGSELGTHGITYAAMGADSTLYSISYTRDGPAVTEGERCAVAWKLRYLNDLVRRYCKGLNVFGRGTLALTSREIEILRWTADGKCANDVAMILGISRNTVNFHVKQIFKKMECNTKLQATTYAAAINVI
jgi:LuxR family transcriptional activator of rhlAB and lasB